jgi:carbon monoxide dehydrogenase subunit G
MERVEASRHFGVPAERAFAFITDTRNWAQFFPGFVALDPTSRFAVPGDVASLTSKILGRDRRVYLTLERIDPNRSFSYTSRQEGLPDAHHERTFTPEGEGFRFGLSVSYQPRRGLRGLVDRIVLRPAVRRLLARTLDALEVALAA